jgi:uncharacterized protein with HEPN domain
MRPEDDDAARVWDIVDCARRLIKMTAGRSYIEFVNDDQLRLASERCMEIIGEAASHVSDSFRSRFRDVPWSQIVGLRNIIAHGYTQLDHDKLWNDIQHNVPTLLERLSPLVDDE